MRNFFKISIILAFLCLVSACANTPIAKEKAKLVSAEKQVHYRERTSENNASIAVIRDKGFQGSICDSDILLNNDKIGQIGPGEYIELFVKPGEYLLGATPRVCLGDPKEIKVVLKPNEERRYRVGYDSDGFVLTVSDKN